MNSPLLAGLASNARPSTSDLTPAQIPAPALIDDIRTPLSSPVIDDPIPSPIAVIDAPPTIDPALTNNGAANESKAPKFTRADELNWADRDEVMGNLDLFEVIQQYRFGMAETKRIHYPKGFNKGYYFPNLIPIIASNYPRADKILGCGNNWKWKKFPCDQWAFCSKCASVRAVKASKMFKGTFDDDSFFHVTLGFDGEIPFDETKSMDARVYWQRNESAIRALLEKGVIHGAYMAHEIKVRSFLPLRINPHTHVVIAAAEFPDEVTAALVDMIGGAEGVNLKPSIAVKEINTQSYHDHCIRYLTKEMDLQAPYSEAWVKHCEKDRKMAPELNREVRVFLDAQAAAFGGMNRVVYMGNLRCQNKSFIGVRKADRESKTKPKRKKAKKKR